MEIKVIERVLGANDMVAGELRELFKQRKIKVLNIMGTPGAGKTSVVERTIRAIGADWRVAVIEGDIATSLDAEKLAKLNIPVVQINTGGACHLDASMIKSATQQLDLGKIDLLIIENVGNLVCPAEFDLGEDKKILVSSVAEGDDKVQKYPLMFRTADAIILNKIDLSPAVEFNNVNFKLCLSDLNPHAPLFEISCKTGENIEQWTSWLIDNVLNQT